MEIKVTMYPTKHIFYYLLLYTVSSKNNKKQQTEYVNYNYSQAFVYSSLLKSPSIACSFSLDLFQSVDVRLSRLPRDSRSSENKLNSWTPFLCWLQGYKKFIFRLLHQLTTTRKNMYAVLDHGSSSKYKISLFRRPNSFGSCVTYLSCEVFCTEFDFSLASPAVGMVLASHDFLHKQETEELTTSRWRNRRKNRLFTPGTRLKRLVQHVYFRSDPCVFGQRIRDRLFLANQNLRKIQNQNVPD